MIGNVFFRDEIKQTQESSKNNESISDYIDGLSSFLSEKEKAHFKLKFSKMHPDEDVHKLYSEINTYYKNKNKEYSNILYLIRHNKFLSELNEDRSLTKDLTNTYNECEYNYNSIKKFKENIKSLIEGEKKDPFNKEKKELSAHIENKIPSEKIRKSLIKEMNSYTDLDALKGFSNKINKVIGATDKIIKKIDCFKDLNEHEKEHFVEEINFFDIDEYEKALNENLSKIKEYCDEKNRQFYKNIELIYSSERSKKDIDCYLEENHKRFTKCYFGFDSLKTLHQNIKLIDDNS